MQQITDHKRKTLLALPQRDWRAVSTYDHVLLVPTGRKHDSGYSLIAIVGVNYEGEEANRKEMGEIAATCDDIGWLTDRSRVSEHFAALRMDCYYPSGILRMWGGYEFRFEVGVSLSSTDVRMVPKAPKDKVIKLGPVEVTLR